MTTNVIAIDELIDAKIEHAQQYGAWHVRNGDSVPLTNWTENVGLQYIQRVEIALRAYEKVFDAEVNARAERIATKLIDDRLKQKR